MELLMKLCWPNHALSITDTLDKLLGPDGDDRFLLKANKIASNDCSPLAYTSEDKMLLCQYEGVTIPAKLFPSLLSATKILGLTSFLRPDLQSIPLIVHHSPYIQVCPQVLLKKIFMYILLMNTFPFQMSLT